MSLTKTDIEQAVDLVFTLAKQGAAATKWSWDDTVVTWALAGRDGFVKMVCRMFGVSTTMQAGPGSTPPKPLLQMAKAPQSPEATLKACGLTDEQIAGKSVEWMQVFQFVLQLLTKVFGPFAPVPTPAE